MSRKITAVIPARMDSTRFPGKPLVPILGLPLIEHVRRRVELMSLFDDVYVATCDNEIKELVETHGGRVIMTANTHERAADRVEEAAKQLDSDIVVMVQGDEPMVVEAPFLQLVEPFTTDSSIGCTCLVYPILDQDELTSLNVVKTVQSRSGNLLYFSRSTIPGNPVDSAYPYLKQSGIMAFTKERLHLFSKLESTPLEQKESCDMLRYIEHDLTIRGVYSEVETKGVDIPSQVEEIESAIQNDPGQMEIHNRITAK